MKSKLPKIRRPYGSTADDAFEAIAIAVMQGGTDTLTSDQQRTLALTKEAYHIICDTPNKSASIKKMAELHPEMTERQALNYINYGIRIWNPHHKLDRDFLDTVFVNALIGEITAPDADPDIKAKNLATLQRYIASMPSEPVDPTIMQKNDIYIQLNMNGSTINVPADKWGRIKDNKIIAAAMLEQEITDEQAGEIMDT